MSASTFTFAAQAVSFGIASSTWRGVSGEVPSGSAVADHLEMTADVLQRADWEPTFGRHLVDAQRAARAGGVGDEDTQVVGRELMELILRAHLASPWALVDAWAEKPDRPIGEVLELLAAAAELARAYGPAKAVAS